MRKLQIKKGWGQQVCALKARRGYITLGLGEQDAGEG
jgi:hypothetical protein